MTRCRVLIAGGFEEYLEERGADPVLDLHGQDTWQRLQRRFLARSFA